MNIVRTLVKTKSKVKTQTVVLLAVTAAAASMAIYASSSLSILKHIRLTAPGYTPGYTSSK